MRGLWAFRWAVINTLFHFDVVYCWRWWESALFVVPLVLIKETELSCSMILTSPPPHPFAIVKLPHLSPCASRCYCAESALTWSFCVCSCPAKPQLKALWRALANSTSFPAWSVGRGGYTCLPAFSLSCFQKGSIGEDIYASHVLLCCRVECISHRSNLLQFVLH